MPNDEEYDDRYHGLVRPANKDGDVNRITFTATDEQLRTFEEQLVTGIHNLNDCKDSLKKLQLACGTFHVIQSIALAYFISLISSHNKTTYCPNILVCSRDDFFENQPEMPLEQNVRMWYGWHLIISTP